MTPSLDVHTLLHRGSCMHTSYAYTCYPSCLHRSCLLKMSLKSIASARSLEDATQSATTFAPSFRWEHLAYTMNLKREQTQARQEGGCANLDKHRRALAGLPGMFVPHQTSVRVHMVQDELHAKGLGQQIWMGYRYGVLTFPAHSSLPHADGRGIK
jgi:hypothetical protein